MREIYEECQTDRQTDVCCLSFQLMYELNTWSLPNIKNNCPDIMYEKTYTTKWMWFHNEFTFSIWFVACRLVREWWLWYGCNRIQQQTSYVRKMCVYLRWCYWQMSLTIQLDAAVRVTERILRDTLVRTEIRGCHSLDCQLHVHFVSVVQQNWLVFTTCTHTHTHTESIRKY